MKYARTKQGAETLANEAQALKSRFTGSALYSPYYSAVMSAWENADDTMLEQGYKNWSADAELEAKWNDYFWISLSCVLAECPYSHVVTWFKKRGITG